MGPPGPQGPSGAQGPPGSPVSASLYIFKKSFVCILCHNAQRGADAVWSSGSAFYCLLQS